jgi:hypothetical protein
VNLSRRVDNALTSDRLVYTMTRRALFSQPISVFVLYVLLGCNSAVSLPQPAHPAPDQRLSQQEPAGEPALMVLDISGPVAGPDNTAGDEQLGEVLDAEQTVVAVNEESVAEASRLLRFSAETRGSETIGVRVFFATAEAEKDEGTHLGLRVADRVEEVEGLPIASLDALARAWRDVGRKPEVHFLIRRGERAHTIVYRLRSFGMP